MTPDDALAKEEIAQVWEEVRVRVVKLADGDPRKLRANLSAEDILAYLDRAQRTDAAAAAKHSTIKNVFDKTLQCISHVGGIIAGGASAAFPPANLCFNAVNFVILAWQGYQGVYDSLAELLQRCGEFLDRLPYYEKGGMDVKLTRLACQHLHLFVQICDRAIALRHKWRMKTKILAELFFLGDSDIKDILGVMERLVDKETHLVLAQTFASSRGTETKVDILVQDRTDQKKEKEQKKQRIAVFKALDFDEDMIDKTQTDPELNAIWNTSQRNFRKSLIPPETGEWISNEPEFLNWIEATPESSPILAIEGIEGSGKSHLMSTIIRKLCNSEFEGNSESRSVVAYYYLDRSSKEDSVRNNAFDRVSKSLIWQMSQDASYQKSVANICQKRGALDPEEVLQLLLLENTERLKMNARFFIIIDGFGDIGEPYVNFLRKIAKQSRDRPVRVLVSGSPQTFQSLRDEAGVSLEAIDISTRNQVDVKRYIEHRMNSMHALKDPKRTGVLALREKIRDRLCEETRGDYYKIDRNLDVINSLETDADIDGVLETAGAERLEQIKAEIEQLNNERTPKEIAEINEIAMWLTYGKYWFTPEEIDTALFMSNEVSSWIPLEEKLKTKYTLFLVDKDGDVDFKSRESMLKAIPLREVMSSAIMPSNDDSKIYPAEVDLVRHFLTTVCPPKTYNKFGFEAFFKQRLNLKSSYICQESASDSELRLANTCLRILTAEYDEKHKPLLDYARSSFVTHLRCSDLAQADRHLKSMIGPHLLKLFSQDEAVDTLFWNTHDPENTYRMYLNRETWLFENAATKVILEWMKDSAVISEVVDQTRCKQLASSIETLLEPVARRMAWHCFREENSRMLTGNAFLFLFGYFAKAWNQVDTQTEAITNATLPTLEQIKSDEAKALTMLGCDEKDSLWETQAAVLLYACDHETEAEARCKNALRLDPENWRASHYLAKLVDPKEGIEILEILTQRLSKSEEWMATEPHRESFADMLFDLGDKYLEKGDFDLATPIYKRGLEFNPEAFSHIRNFLLAYDNSSRWAEIIDFLEMLKKENEDTKTPLNQLICDNASDDEFHDMILHVTSQTGRSDLIDDLYLGSIRVGIELKVHYDTFFLRHFYGIAQSHRAEGEDGAIATWELAIKENFTSLSSYDKQLALRALTRVLAPVYLRRARTAKLESTQADDYVQRIVTLLHDEETERTLICPPKMYAARYYQLRGDVTKAKTMTHAQIEVALEMLSDDDLENDWEAYWRLVCVFVPLEDDEFALAAWAMATFAAREAAAAAARSEMEASGAKTKSDGTMSRNEAQPAATNAESLSSERPADASPVIDSNNQEHDLEDAGQLDDVATSPMKEANSSTDAPSQEETAEVTVNGEDTKAEIPSVDGLVFVAGCDGDCDHNWEWASEMYSCRDCIEVQFEPACFAQLKNGTLKQRVCDKSHDFLYVPKWDHERMNSVPRGHVPLGDRNVPLEEWKTAIKSRYML